jgi:CHAT domain-containing protein/tetratricopeptide (TPR) repeat protein
MALAGASAIPVAVVAVLISLPLKAQTASAETSPKNLIEKADRLAWLYNWYMAGPLYIEAEKLFEQAGDRRNALYAGIGRLRSQWESLSFREVSEYLATELDSPLVQKDPQLRLWILDAKGAVDIEVNVRTARQVYEECRDLARTLGDKARESRASGELGIIAFMEGETGKSLELLAGALKMSIELRDAGAQIRYLNLVGSGLATFGRPEDAIRYYDRALQLVHSIPELDTSTMAITGKAKALVALGKKAEAEKLFQEALTLARSRNRRGLAASLLIELAKLRTASGEQQQAIEFYQEAVALAKAGELDRFVATASFGLAGLYRSAGDLEKAEDSAGKGVAASQRIEETFELPERLGILARLRADRGKIEDADRLYEQAEDVVEGILVSVASPNSRALIIGALSQIYVDHFTMAINRLNNPARAFEVLERARGRTTADLLRAKEGPTGNISQARIYEREITKLQARLMRSITRDERKQILDKIFAAEQELYAAKFTGSQRLMERGSPIGLASFQEGLGTDELVVEYALGEPRSHALLIGRTGISAVSLPDRGIIESLVEKYLGAVRSRKAATEVAKELYSMLLGPIRSQQRKPRLIIVPDGKLHLIPFDALVNENDKYVLMSNVVTYAPSSTVLHLLRSRPQDSGTNVPLLAVGDVPYQERRNLVASNGNGAKPSQPTTRGLYDLGGERLPALPGSAEEVAAVAAVAGNRSIVLTGPKATETEFRLQPLDKVRMLHLAVHGISSSTSPERAALVLARGTGDDDGLLQVREISELNLAAELVTLSACDTGAGKLVGQEGIVNLVRAFLFAGTRTVVASVWAADDVFTTSLMKRFYGNLGKGLDRGTALQRAKLDLIGQYGDDALPFLWAGFTMAGEGSRPIRFSD